MHLQLALGRRLGHIGLSRVNVAQPNVIQTLIYCLWGIERRRRITINSASAYSGDRNSLNSTASFGHVDPASWPFQRSNQRR